MDLKGVMLIEGSQARRLLIKCTCTEPECRLVVMGMGGLIDCKYAHGVFRDDGNVLKVHYSNNVSTTNLIKLLDCTLAVVMEELNHTPIKLLKLAHNTPRGCNSNSVSSVDTVILSSPFYLLLLKIFHPFLAALLCSF